ncbi:MAG: hypothetical protein L0387_08385 [Acidobacteria bacterium]|nr:hypothetical protein [Acidobacteriota bacterium]MCI0718267.1 hypothetical protein [Acidobacteriota bacterium]
MNGKRPRRYAHPDNIYHYMASNRISESLVRLAMEPPFRLFARAAIKRFPCSIRTKAKWDAVDRPQYLVGVIAAADEAIREGVGDISVFEFGVAGGNGLLALENYSESVEKETGVRISVFGFDTGTGIPELCGDHRDHPDQWRPQDYPMEEEKLRSRLKPRTTLLIGDVAETVPRFVREKQAPSVGFVAVDVDLYSSTKHVLQLFLLPEKRMLRRVTMYFDDTDFIFNHRFAGELLAIHEFNSESRNVKIDRWRGIANRRVFAESPWLEKMYVAHDIEAIGRTQLRRAVASDLGLL